VWKTLSNICWVKVQLTESDALQQTEEPSSTQIVDPFLREVLLKEYELSFYRASSVYNLTHQGITVYTSVVFATLTVVGFLIKPSGKTLYSTLGNSPTPLVIGLLFSLVCFGTANIFIHLSTWAARNYYRKRRSIMLNILLALPASRALNEQLLDHICLPRYVHSGLLRSLSLYLWYFLFIIACNTVVGSLLLGYVIGGINLRWLFLTFTFLALQCLLAEWYVQAKSREHSKQSDRKRNTLRRTMTEQWIQMLSKGR